MADPNRSGPSSVESGWDEPPDSAKKTVADQSGPRPRSASRPNLPGLPPDKSAPIEKLSPSGFVQRPPDQKPRTAQRPPDDEPALEEEFPDDSRWSDERRRQERGNRGPGEEPGRPERVKPR
jgi:hypothetical protein